MTVLYHGYVVSINQSKLTAQVDLFIVVQYQIEVGCSTEVTATLMEFSTHCFKYENKILFTLKCMDEEEKPQRMR